MLTKPIRGIREVRGTRVIGIKTHPKISVAAEMGGQFFREMARVGKEMEISIIMGCSQIFRVDMDMGRVATITRIIGEDRIMVLRVARGREVDPSHQPCIFLPIKPKILSLTHLLIKPPVLIRCLKGPRQTNRGALGSPWEGRGP